MANEISVNINVACTVAGITTQGFKAQSANNASGDVQGTVQAVTTSGAIVGLGGVPMASIQVLYLRNNDPTNVITVYTDSGFTDVIGVLQPVSGASLTLPYGVPMVIVPLQGGTAPYVKATTATCQLQVVAFGS